jgi:hypothetical protein
MIDEQVKLMMIADIKKVHPHHIVIGAIENNMGHDEFISQCCTGLIAAAQAQLEIAKDKDVMVFKANGAIVTVHFEAEDEDKPAETKKRFSSIPA